jgi:hypothetical protein
MCRHAPNDPKQAATHAAFRAGACHSTTEIIVFPLAVYADVSSTMVPRIANRNTAPDLGSFRARRRLKRN